MRDWICGFFMAWGMFLAIPCPRKIWSESARQKMLVCMPLVACPVQAADAISAARPGARRENIENYVKRLEKLEEVTKSFPGIANCFAIQAGREIRIMVKPEEVSEDQMVLLARDIAKKIEDELTYPGQIKVNLLRETKAVDYAK